MLPEMDMNMIKTSRLPTKYFIKRRVSVSSQEKPSSEEEDGNVSNRLQLVFLPVVSIFLGKQEEEVVRYSGKYVDVKTK